MTQSAPSDTGAEITWAERHYRSIKIAVIVMGILLVVGFGVVFATIAARMAGGPPAPDAPVATALEGELANLFAADTEVVSTTVDGSRLALVLRRETGLAVVVVDLRSGELINVIAPAAE